MREPTTEAPALAARYFAHEEGSVQAVHNLRDPGPYLAAGYEEVDEDTYQALAAPHAAGEGA